MANIPPLKKVLPTSPDQILRTSAESESAVARMAHLNRAALYIGNEIATDDVSYTTSQELALSKPCGLLTITDLGIAAGDNAQFDLVFNQALYDVGANVSTPAFVQLTIATSDNDFGILYIRSIPVVDGFINVEIYNNDTVNDLDTVVFFYTVIPQI